MDVVAVTGGQDHGARFGLRGSEATIGRGPVMDIVLTDPRVAHRHARLRIVGRALVVEDLASDGGTHVRGVAIAEPTALALGDRLVLGDTELTVIWTPTEGAAQPVPQPPPPRPASALPPPPPALVPARLPRARPSPRALTPPAICLALAALALLPLGSLAPKGLRVETLVVALVTAAVATGWLLVPMGRLAPAIEAPLAMAAAIGGGLVAGPALFALASDLPGVGSGGGSLPLTLLGIAIVGCALTRFGGAPDVPARTARDRTSVLGLLGVAMVGGLLCAAASPLTWISSPGPELGGLDAGVGAGRWLLALALTAAAAAGIAGGLIRLDDAHLALGLCACAAALAAADLAFALAATITFGDYQTEVGLSLSLAGSAVALVGAGSAAVVAALRPTRPPAPTRA